MNTNQQPEQIILAGDMALRFGLAIGSTTRGYLASTVIDVNEQRHGTSLARAVKFAQMKTRLWVQQHGIKLVHRVVYEEPSNTASSNKLPQYAMVTGLILAGDDLGCWLTKFYWPPTVKSFCTGHGNAKKPAMIAAANDWTRDKLAREILDDNEADAVCLLRLAIAEINGQYVRPAKKKRKGGKPTKAQQQAGLF